MATKNRRIARTLTTSIAALLAHTSAQAQDILWAGAVNNVTGGAWGTATNWTGSNIPDTNTERADLRLDWTGTAPTFILGANRTINGLYYDDTGASGDLAGTINAGNTLTLDGTTPFVNVVGPNLTMSNVLNWTATGWAKQGVGTLILAGANTGAGPITLGNGSIQANNNSAFGTATVNFVTGGATNPTRVLVNGGVTINNAMNIANHFGVAGFGSIQHTGTGLATVTGALNITGGPSAGRHFVGGTTAANSLVINLNPAVGMSR